MLLQRTMKSKLRIFIIMTPPPKKRQNFKRRWNSDISSHTNITIVLPKNNQYETIIWLKIRGPRYNFSSDLYLGCVYKSNKKSY